MCIICIELIKHRMTITEAGKAAKECNGTEKSSEHMRELEEAIENLDLEKLGELLDEGEI